jgi:beta-lactamase class D
VHQRHDWKKYFSDQGLTGCFMLHNTALNIFNIYNLQGTQTRYSPGASFDLMNAMVGLETGVIADTNTVFRDSLGKSPAGLESMTLAKAFRTGDSLYFMEVARRVGNVKMQFWLDSIRYGNTLMGKRVDRFWLDNSLKISADEQLGFLQGLYTEKLPFQPRTQRLVKALLFQRQNIRYSLYDKTAIAIEDGKQIGWITGWIQTGDRPHFFVLCAEEPGTQKDIKPVITGILGDILRGEDLFHEDKNGQKK